jgi:hypothetical protein
MAIQDKILKHLKSGHSLTAHEAAMEYGTLRLSAYIYNLRDKGHEIKTRQKQMFNGKTVAEYVLKNDKEQK